MNKDFVSVVLRTRSRPILLQRALTCIKAQSITAIELVIVHEADEKLEVTQSIQKIWPSIAPSTTGSADFVAPGGITIKLAENPQPYDRTAAISAGLALASADMLAFLDDDDSWSPNFLQQLALKLSEAHAKWPFVHAVATRANHVREVMHGPVVSCVSVTPQDHVQPGLLSLSAVPYHCPLHLSQIIFLRHQLKEIPAPSADFCPFETREYLTRFMLKSEILVDAEYHSFIHTREKASSPAYMNCSDIPESQKRVVLQHIENHFLRSDIERGVMGISSVLDERFSMLHRLHMLEQNTHRLLQREPRDKVKRRWL